MTNHKLSLGVLAFFMAALFTTQGLASRNWTADDLAAAGKLICGEKGQINGKNLIAALDPQEKMLSLEVASGKKNEAEILNLKLNGQGMVTGTDAASWVNSYSPAINNGSLQVRAVVGRAFSYSGTYCGIIRLATEKDVKSFGRSLTVHPRN